MNTKQRLVLNALTRMQAFVHSDPLPRPLQRAPAGFAGQVNVLDTAIEMARANIVDQDSGEPGRHLITLQQLRRTLRDRHLHPIREIAKSLEPGIPGLTRLAALPRQFGSEEKLIAAAQGVLRDLPLFQNRFIERGLAPDFLIRLRTTLTQLQQEARAFSDGRTKKIAGSPGLITALKAGMDAKRCLTTIIRECCADDPVYGPKTLAAWQSIARTWKGGKTAVEIPQNRTPDIPSIPPANTPAVVSGGNTSNPPLSAAA